jgi:uncharacterized protein (TIGR02145 family)
MKKTVLIIGLAVLSLSIFSQETSNFKDPRDGKVYKTVKIGTQWIMAENLAYKPDSGYYWAYNDDKSNVAKLGYLYAWETAKKVAPKGWHLPTKEEWETLYTFLGGDRIKVFEAIDKGGNSGFNALMAGYYCDGHFNDFSSMGAFFWSSTPITDDRAYRFFGALLSQSVYIDNSDRFCGFSVRLFKDN